jgi:hypothetical protein
MGTPNGAFQLEGVGNPINFRAITDGLSNTFLVGEKHVTRGRFGIGWLDCSSYNGDYNVCSSRSAGPDYPIARSIDETQALFGSYHPGICQFGFADGSVRSLPNTIDPTVFGWLANISDGQVIPEF